MMIQDIEPKKLDNQYKNRPIEESDTVIVFKDNQIMIKDSEDLEFYTQAEIGEAEYTYLFSIDDEYFYMAVLDSDIAGSRLIKPFEIRTFKNRYKIFAATTAWHLYHWYDVNQFCGRCGSKAQHDSRERMMRCPKCGNMIFPKIAPAVIVAVRKDDKLLLTKYARNNYTKYALIAGFNEIGESMEATVEREVMEEVGLKVKNIRYYKSQPWGFSGDLLMGYICEAVDDKITLDTNELSVAEWLTRDEVPDYGENLALTHELMKLFKEGKI